MPIAGERGPSQPDRVQFATRFVGNRVLDEEFAELWTQVGFQVGWHGRQFEWHTCSCERHDRLCVQFLRVKGDDALSRSCP